MFMQSIITLVFVITFGLSPSRLGHVEAQWQAHSLITETGWSEKVDWFDNPILVYALCNETQRLDAKHDCMIVQYDDVHNDTAEPRQCKFALEKASHGIVRVEGLTNERTLFVWANDIEDNKRLHWTFNMALIDMPTCHIIDADLVIDAQPWEYGPGVWHLFYTGILAYEDGAFDLYLRNAQACGDTVDDGNCVYAYDNDGQLIEGPVTLYSPSSEKDYYMLWQISRQSRDKGYLLNPGQRQIFIIKKIGQSVSSKVLWNLPMERKDRARSMSAINNELITVCTCSTPTGEMNCICLQSDQEGNSPKEMGIRLKNPPGTVAPYATLVHNLRAGGFLFIPFYTDEDEHFYSVSKVNADGRVVGEPMAIGGHSKKCSPTFVNTRFVELDDGQYCITLACMEKRDAILKTMTKCYPSNFLN